MDNTLSSLGDSPAKKTQIDNWEGGRVMDSFLASPQLVILGGD